MGNEEQNKNEGQNAANGQGQQPKPVDTPAFVKKLLETMGCQYEVNPQNEMEVLTTFQGEKFAIRTAMGYPFVRIHDMWWNSVEMEDLEEVARARKAINEVNGAMPSFTIVYNMSEQEKLMGIHTMAEILLIEAIPNPAGYLHHILEGFFQQKRNFFQCLEAIKKAEKAEKGN